MGLRFRKSVKLAPGIRLNFSKSGVSTTIGPRGASVNIGKKGTYLNAGIPGTGLYMREKISSTSNGHSATSSKAATTGATGGEATNSASLGIAVILILLGILVADGAGIFYFPAGYLTYRAFRRHTAKTKPVYDEQIQYVTDRRYKTGVRPEGTKRVMIGHEPMSEQDIKESRSKAHLRLAFAGLLIILGLWMQFG